VSGATTSYPLDGFFAIVVEDDFSEETRRRVVHVDDDVLETRDGLECALDEVGSCWGEHLERASVGDWLSLLATGDPPGSTRHRAPLRRSAAPGKS
jgi:hypothetical protein